MIAHVTQANDDHRTATRTHSLDASTAALAAVGRATRTSREQRAIAGIVAIARRGRHEHHANITDRRAFTKRAVR